MFSLRGYLCKNLLLHWQWLSWTSLIQWADIGLKTKTELDANLRLFYAEARNKDGENYSRSKLLGLRNGLNRYLNNLPYKKGIHIAIDPAFQQSNQMLDARGAKRQTQTCVIECEDLQRLKESAVITSIQIYVWFHVNLYFNSVDVDRKRKETWRSPVFSSSRMKTANDTQHATMGHDETSKTLRGGHRHKLRESWKNVPESTMKEVSKAAGLYQLLPLGDS